MPWPRKQPDEVGKMRSFRLSDRVNDYIVAKYGSLAEYCRRCEELTNQLNALSMLTNMSEGEINLSNYNRKLKTENK